MYRTMHLNVPRRKALCPYKYAPPCSKEEGMLFIQRTSVHPVKWVEEKRVCLTPNVEPPVDKHPV